MLTSQWHLDKAPAPDAARGRMEYEKLLLKQRKAAEDPVSVVMCCQLATGRAFVMATFHCN